MHYPVLTVCIHQAREYSLDMAEMSSGEWQREKEIK